ncbi:SDR family oxidoreductase [Marinibaculum pumilum]|uniref:SDR family oxidoreductase n=1 Tax=Marinibaculum pumilum TaxID=1766165 RepID=A0ABV7L7F9_9PROT
MGDTVLGSFGEGLNVAVVGATGGIGGAFLARLRDLPAVAQLHALSRRPVPDGAADAWHRLDLEREDSIEAAAQALRASAGELHLVIVATGVLHDAAGLHPEKSWRHLTAEGLAQAFRINAIGPALLARHLLPLLARDRKAAFAALSARVGSIADNRLGGWYGYRASKAALNQTIRCLAIELARRSDRALCVALHPGTVDTPLSAPFQRNVPAAQLSAPAEAAGRLLAVLDGLQPADSGGLFAWDASRIPY